MCETRSAKCVDWQLPLAKGILTPTHGPLLRQCQMRTPQCTRQRAWLYYFRAHTIRRAPSATDTKSHCHWRIGTSLGVRLWGKQFGNSDESMTAVSVVTSTRHMCEHATGHKRSERTSAPPVTMSLYCDGGKVEAQRRGVVAIRSARLAACRVRVPERADAFMFGAVFAHAPVSSSGMGHQ